MREYRNMVVAFVLVVLAFLVTYFLYHLERKRQSEGLQSDHQTLAMDSSLLEAQSLGKVEVAIYVYRPGATVPDQDFLSVQQGWILQTQDPMLNARQIVSEVIRGSRGDGYFDEEARFLEIYLLEDTAVVDLSAKFSELPVAGVTFELATLYSITRSLVENIPEIKQVKFLVNGKDQSTFAGHVFIHEPFM